MSNPIHILYIEDDVDVVRLIKVKLEPLGYVIDHATDGKIGLEMYQSAHYDLLALDERMPGYTGLEILRIITSQGPFPPVIMVTGSGNEQIAVEAMKLGASDYIVKDIGGGYLELLPSVIERVLQQQLVLKEKEQALDALQQRNKGLALLYEAGHAFSSTQDLKHLTQMLLRTATQLSDAEGGSIWLWDEDQPGWLVCQMVFNKGAQESPLNLRLKPGDGIAGWVAQKGESVIVPNVATDPHFSSYIDAQTGFQTKSLISVPLQGREGLIGVLEVVNKSKGQFDEDDLALVQALATPAAMSMDNARMVDSLHQYALQLEERNQELDAFSHTVAHDLRSPLVSIVSYADALRQFHHTMPTNELEEYLEVLVRNGRKMGNIIDELLLLAGVRQLKVQPQPLNTQHIVTEALERIAHLIDKHKANIILPDTWPKALGYAPWIEEVWVNYLSNAIKYGGHPPSLKLGANELPTGIVKFWVKDNGLGLSEEEQSQLFVPFKRLNQIRIQGHGLGLSIVRRIMDKLNGQAGVESKPGEGSLFFFTLPANKK